MITRPRLPFSRKLVVHRWLLGLFGCETFDQLAAGLRDEALEGWTRTTCTAYTRRCACIYPRIGVPRCPTTDS